MDLCKLPYLSKVATPATKPNFLFRHASMKPLKKNKTPLLIATRVAIEHRRVGNGLITDINPSSGLNQAAWRQHYSLCSCGSRITRINYLCALTVRTVFMCKGLEVQLTLPYPSSQPLDTAVCTDISKPQHKSPLRLPAMHFSFISWGDQMKQTHTSHTYTTPTPPTPHLHPLQLQPVLYRRSLPWQPAASQPLLCVAEAPVYRGSCWTAGCWCCWREA